MTICLEVYFIAFVFRLWLNQLFKYCKSSHKGRENEINTRCSAVNLISNSKDIDINHVSYDCVLILLHYIAHVFEAGWHLYYYSKELLWFTKVKIRESLKHRMIFLQCEIKRSQYFCYLFYGNNFKYYYCFIMIL